MNAVVRRRALLVGALVVIAAAVTLGLNATTGRSARAAVPAKAGTKSRFPLSRPDPKGARPLPLYRVWPGAETERHYGAELMTYRKARRIAPGLAAESSAVVNPSRKVWVITVYYHPPETMSGAVLDTPVSEPSGTVRVHTTSQIHDAVTGTAIDSCINCTAVPEQLRYWSEHVTLSRVPGRYRPAVSRAEVLELLRESGFSGFGSGQKPVVRLWSARGGSHPGTRSYPAWVVTYPHTAPTSYGPGRVSQKPDCAFVSIYDLRDRVWTTHFQDCPDVPTRAGVSCDDACTPADQDALDADADDAQRIAGSAYYTGTVIDDAADTVVVYLADAPQSVIDELQAAHPGMYVIHNDAPHTHAALMKLEGEIVLTQGINANECGPTADGYLQVGVLSDVAAAQAKLDEMYGPNLIHVVKSSPIIAVGLRAAPAGKLVGAIRTAGGPAGESLRKGGGLVTVFDSRGRTVAAERTRPGHDFRFRLAPGRYRLGFGKHGRQDRGGCSRRPIAVRAGKTTHADLLIGCDWP